MAVSPDEVPPEQPPFHSPQSDGHIWGDGGIHPTTPSFILPFSHNICHTNSFLLCSMNDSEQFLHVHMCTLKLKSHEHSKNGPISSYEIQ